MSLLSVLLEELAFQEFNDQVILTHGDVRLVINKSPWRLQIYHNSTGALVLSEATVADHRLVKPETMLWSWCNVYCRALVGGKESIWIFMKAIYSEWG